MAMNRKQRRAGRKDRFRMIEGGGEAPAPRADTSAPAGRFAVALDRFTKEHFAKNGDMDGMQACAVLLQVAAGIAVELDGNHDEFTKAAGHFFIEEFEARKSDTKPPSGPSGARG